MDQKRFPALYRVLATTDSVRVTSFALSLEYSSKDPKFLKLKEPQNAGLLLSLENKISKKLGALEKELETIGFPADPNPRAVLDQSGILIFATFLPQSSPVEENKYLEAFKNACQQAVAELNIRDTLPHYIKTTNSGHPVFDTEKGFEIIEFETGRFAYVNHTEKLLLPSFGSKEAVERNKDSFLAHTDSIEKAKQRYKTTL